MDLGLEDARQAATGSLVGQNPHYSTTCISGLALTSKSLHLGEKSGYIGEEARPGAHPIERLVRAAGLAPCQGMVWFGTLQSARMGNVNSGSEAERQAEAAKTSASVPAGRSALAGGGKGEGHESQS